MTAAVGVAGALLLYAAYPERALEWHMSRAAQTDPVLTLLLRAYTRLEPDNVDRRIALFRQLLAEGRFGEAERALAPLLVHADQIVRGAALRLRFDLVERAVMAMRPGSAERTAGMERLAGLMQELTSEGISTRELSRNVQRLLDADAEARAELLAQHRALEKWDMQPADPSQSPAPRGEAARESGEPAASGAAVNGSSRAASSGAEAPADSRDQATIAPAPRPAGPVERARVLLGEGKHVLAAQAYLQAMDAAPSYELRRRYFLEALRTYQAASKFDEAFAAANASGQPFMRDLVVVEFLVRLGRAANRPDIAERYVRIMLRLSSSGPRAPLAGHERSLVAAAMRWVIAEAHAAEEDLSISLPFDDARYLLAFEVFLANKNQTAARQVAAEAVRRAPRDPQWRKRYAQVSEWDGQAHLALQQWLAYAEMTEADDGWAAVKRLAAPLFDHEIELKLLARERKQRPQDLKLISATVELHERLGTPDKAVEFLREILREQPRRELFMLLAELAHRMGRDELALETYDALIARFGQDADVAIKQAVIAYSIRQVERAWRFIERAKDVAHRAHVEYWRMYASLAELTAKFDAATHGFRVLAGRPDAEAKDFEGLISVLQGRFPLEAGRVALIGYERFGRLDWLMIALQLNSEQRNWTGFRNALGLVRDADWAKLRADARFLVLRAGFYQATGAERLALSDLLQAFDLSPRDQSVRQSLLWALLSMRRVDVLRNVVVRWHKDAEANRELWAPFAAAYMLMNEPKKALRYYTKLVGTGASRSNDYLLLVSFAGALEQAGDVERAWRVRRHVWTQLRDPETLKQVRDPARLRDLKRTTAQLAMSFAPGDAASKLIGELLYTHGATEAGIDPALKELALSWLLSAEAHDAAGAWYLRQYARDLAANRDRPYWAMLSIALANDDRPAVAKLLDEQADLLPLGDRVEAAARLGRTAQTFALAREWLERYPDNSDAHERFTSLAMTDAEQLVAEIKRTQIGALRSTDTALRGRLELNGVKLGLGIDRRQQASRDVDTLVGVPGVDQTFEASAQIERPLGKLGLSLTRRDALAPHTGARLEWTRQRERWSGQLSAGLRQRANESMLLRLGGMKDSVEGNISYRFTKYDSMNAMLRFDRFASQNRVRLGSGRVESLEFAHAFRLEYPDARVRVFASRNQFGKTGTTDPAFARFSPDGSVPDSDAVIPRRYILRGVGVSLGLAQEGNYTRAIRPFADYSVTKNSAFGHGQSLRIGAAGNVFGRDQLSIYFNYSRGARGTRDVTREIAVRYAW